MVDYHDSSQLHMWMLNSEEELEACRARSNYEARVFLRELSEKKKTEDETETATTSSSTSDVPFTASHFVCDANERAKTLKRQPEGGYENAGPWESADGKPFLNHKEEAILVSFYASKLVNLIGPAAAVKMLRRPNKVLGTAATLLRRFYLSNSVMLFDPSAVMVAAAFLASKSEDATVRIGDLEQATILMNKPVTQQQIINGEVNLLAGVHFYLLCFHPYKAVSVLTDDLRTFFKTAAGKRLLEKTGETIAITGQQIKPIYDISWTLLDDVIISDLPLLYTPGQIGMATLMAAQEMFLEQHKQRHPDRPPPPKIHFMGYIQERFPKEDEEGALEWLPETLSKLSRQLRELKQGKYGCGNYFTDLSALKKINKKAKKVAIWRNEGSDSDEKKKKKKKEKKKNPDEVTSGNNENSASQPADKSGEPPAKRVKTE